MLLQLHLLLLILPALLRAYSLTDSRALLLNANAPVSPHILYNFGGANQEDRSTDLNQLNSQHTPPGVSISMTFDRIGQDTTKAKLYFFVLQGHQRSHYEEFECQDLRSQLGKSTEELPMAVADINSSIASVDAFVHVREQELGELYILFCPEVHVFQEGLLYGKLQFLNTWGHLGYQFLPIYYFLIIFEVVTLILYAGYAVGLCRERSNFVWIHGLILALACISLVTNALLIVIFAAFNKTGHIETPIVYTQQALVNVQNTIARVLLLMLFKGYGLMNVTLPKIKIILVSLLYLLACLGFTVVVDIDFKNNPRASHQLFVLSFFLMLIMQLVMYIWIATSYLSTLKLLIQRKQLYKQRVIKSIFYSVAIAVLLSAIIGIAGVMASIWGSEAMARARQFVVEGCWKFFFACALFWIMILIRPSRQTNLLIQHEELHEEFGGIELGDKATDDEPVAPESDSEPQFEPTPAIEPEDKN